MTRCHHPHHHLIRRRTFLADLGKLFPGLQTEDFRTPGDSRESVDTSELIAPLLRLRSLDPTSSVLTELAGWPRMTAALQRLEPFSPPGVEEGLLPAIAEVNKDKFGCFTPGTNIPIISELEAHAMKPDYFFVLPWPFRNNLIQRESAFLQRGGRMIFPLPALEIYSEP
jgi:hypothetical protein